jgi:parallel beta-helix repeat protein
MTTARLHSRRTLLAAAVGLAVAAVLPACGAAPAPAATPQDSPETFPSATRARGATQINVRDKGARGDGVQDDTAAFQRAVDALPDDGGTVVVPSGNYLIDPLQAVRLRNRMHLQLAPDATLVAKATAAGRSYVLWLPLLEDVEISGGRIVGERARHLGAGGEWGHGIQIVGSSRVTVRDMHISDCWGDGLYVGTRKGGNGGRVPSNDVVIDGVVATGNRRQGLSIGGARNVWVRNCEFSHTNGTAPQCGIDIEPDGPDVAVGVRIQHCRLTDNAAFGLQVFKRSQDVTVEDCTIERNRRSGLVAVGCSGGNFVGNSIRDNGGPGLVLKGGSRNFTVARNTFAGNGSGGPLGLALGARGKGKRDLVIDGSAVDVRVDANTFL